MRAWRFFVRILSQTHLYVKPRLKCRHVIFLGESNLFRLHNDAVDLKVRQEKLRHDGPSGHARPVRAKEISEWVDFSVFALRDVQPVEGRQPLEILCSGDWGHGRRGTGRCWWSSQYRSCSGRQQLRISRNAVWSGLGRQGGLKCGLNEIDSCQTLLRFHPGAEVVRKQTALLVPYPTGNLTWGFHIRVRSDVSVLLQA